MLLSFESLLLLLSILTLLTRCLCCDLSDFTFVVAASISAAVDVSSAMISFRVELAFASLLFDFLTDLGTFSDFIDGMEAKETVLLVEDAAKFMRKFIDIGYGWNWSA